MAKVGYYSALYPPILLFPAKKSWSLFCLTKFCSGGVEGGGSLLWQEERLTMQISSPAAPLYSSFHGVWRRPQRARRRRRRRRQRLGSLSWIEEEGEENSKPINLGAACSERREPGQRKSRRFCLLLIIATCAPPGFHVHFINIKRQLY